MQTAEERMLFIPRHRRCSLLGHQDLRILTSMNKSFIICKYMCTYFLKNHYICIQCICIFSPILSNLPGSQCLCNMSFLTSLNWFVFLVTSSPFLHFLLFFWSLTKQFTWAVDTAWRKNLLVMSQFHLTAGRTFSSYILMTSLLLSLSFSSRQHSCSTYPQIQFLTHTHVPEIPASLFPLISSVLCIEAIPG